MVKVALIGCGGIGEFHLSHFKNFHDVEFVGFCDLILSRAQAFVDQLGCGRAFGNFIEMYDAVEPDAVFICVPPTSHGEIEFETIRRGIPFFVQKPLALDVALMREIKRRVEEKHLITAVGFQCRYDNINDFTREFIADAGIVTVAASRVGDIPSAPWWRVKSTSGGQLVEQTIHQLDILRYMLGEPDTVYSVASRGYVTEEECPGYFTDDLSTTLITFKSGVTCTLMTGCYSKNGASWDSKITFGGRSARLDYRLCQSAIAYGIDQADVAEAVAGVIQGDGTQRRSEHEVGVEVKSEVDFGEICDRTFLDAVISGDASQIRSPYADGYRTTAFALACNESMQTGQPVKVQD